MDLVNSTVYLLYYQDKRFLINSTAPTIGILRALNDIEDAGDAAD